jgi:regulator of replication initiation timing
MSDRPRRVVPRVGEVGMREAMFLKNKLREAHAFMESLLIENNLLKEDNQKLRQALWAEMTRDKSKEKEEDVEMDEAMEELLPSW